MLSVSQRWLLTGSAIIFLAVLLMGCSPDRSVTKGTDHNLKKVDFKPPISSKSAPAKGAAPSTGIVPGK